MWECEYGEDHEYPDDWNFGPSGTDPRADWRFLPSSYTYLDAAMEGAWQTSVPLCDDEALDNFTKVQNEVNYDPPLRYLMVRRPGEHSKPHVLPFVYNAETDMVYPTGS